MESEFVDDGWQLVEHAINFGLSVVQSQAKPYAAPGARRTAPQSGQYMRRLQRTCGTGRTA